MPSRTRGESTPSSTAPPENTELAVSGQAMWSPPPPPLPLQLRRPTLPLLHQGRRSCRRLNRIAASQEDPLTALSRVLWGRALPPSQLVLAVRHGWTAGWRLLMRQLAPSNPATGAFTRTPSRFPAVVTAPSPGTRLHLYVGLPCPWAHRALLVRALLGLGPRLPVSVAVPGDDGAWSFMPNSPDALYGKRRLRDVYAARRGGFEGRASVPMLWDADRREVVCNESVEIAKFLCTLADSTRTEALDLWPPELRQEIDRWYGVIYPSVNNGVYRCGFAQSQAAYDAAAGELFATLDMLEDHLSKSRYLCAAGSSMTLADVCLFTTLIRFDLVYNPLFRCSRRKLVEYPSLHAYTREIYQMPGVAETCNMAAIADGYFGTLFPLNPGGIQPVVPASCDQEALMEPHGREVLPSAAGAGLQLGATASVG